MFDSDLSTVWRHCYTLFYTVCAASLGNDSSTRILSTIQNNVRSLNIGAGCVYCNLGDELLAASASLIGYF